MNKKQKTKYLIAIYGIVLCISIILSVIAYYQNDGIFSQSILLNLATELLGVVLVFFLVNYLFSLDEWDINDRIKKLLSKLEETDKVNSDKFFHEKLSIKGDIKLSNKIDFCGVALSTTVDSYLSDLRDFIRKGGKLRILIMENTDENLKTASNRSEEDDKLYYKKKIESTLHNIRYLNAQTTSDNGGKLEVGFLAYPPSIGIQIFEKGGNDRTCTIEMYSHHIGWGEPPNFTLERKNDEKWYDYFVKQYEAMWEKSKRLNLEELEF